MRKKIYKKTFLYIFSFGLIFTLLFNFKFNDNVKNDGLINYSKYSSPIINSVEINNIASKSVTVDWNIDDNGYKINFFRIIGSDVNKLEGTNSIDIPYTGNNTDSKLIENLTPNKTYSDWQFSIQYQDVNSLSQYTKINIASFKMLDLEIPIISSVYVDKITENSVEINWKVEDINSIATSFSIIHPNVGTGQTIIRDLTKTSIIINYLTPSTTYSDWNFVVNFKYTPITNESILQEIDSFKTLEKTIIPEINKLYISKITETSVTINWNVKNDSSIITSFSIIHFGVEENITLIPFYNNNIGSVTIDKLEPNTIYSNWIFSINYDLYSTSKHILQNINSFKTLNYLIPPIINFVYVSDITKTSVKINWNIYDPNFTINLIEITHPNVNGGLTIIESLNATSIQINGLTPSTTYDNWQLIVNYRDSSNLNSKQVIKNINSFTTLI